MIRTLHNHIVGREALRLPNVLKRYDRWMLAVRYARSVARIAGQCWRNPAANLAVA